MLLPAVCSFVLSQLFPFPTAIALLVLVTSLPLAMYNVFHLQLRVFHRTSFVDKPKHIPVSFFCGHERVVQHAACKH